MAAPARRGLAGRAPMSNKHSEAKKVAEEHKKDPDNTGCMWRHPKKGEPCDYWKHSFDASKAHSEVFALSSSTYWSRAQKIIPDQAEYERQAAAREAAKKKEAAREQARISALQGQAQTADVQKRLAAAQKKLARAQAFSKDDFLKRHRAMYSGPMERLRLNHGNAWDVGARAPANLLASVEYMGKKGAKGPGGLNHDPYGLGMWYPYDHNHHHLIPIAEVAKMIGQTSGTVTLEDRIDVLVKSTWNVNKQIANGPTNVLILPENVTVANILGLPAHCPWDRASHPAYSASVTTRLTPISQSINDACSVEGDKQAKHDARAAAAAELKRRLEGVSSALFKRVTSGAHAGLELRGV
jgi:hypothetical protein